MEKLRNIFWIFFIVNCRAEDLPIYKSYKDIAQISSLCDEKNLFNLKIISSNNSPPNSFVYLHMYLPKKLNIEVQFDKEGVYNVKDAMKVNIDQVKQVYGRQYTDFYPYGEFKFDEKSVKDNELPTSFTYSHEFIHENKRPLSIEIEFYDRFYFGRRSSDSSSNYFMLGINHAWVGCPQPLCLYGTIDAAYADNGGHYVFRGAYYWNIKNGPPLIKNSLLITSLNKDLPFPVDSAFAFDKQRYFTKEKRIYCLDEKNNICSGFESGLELSGFFSGKNFAPQYNEAAFVISQTNEIGLIGSDITTITFFTADPSVFGVIGKFKMSRSIPLPATLTYKIDAMFEINSFVYIFKQWNNYKLPVDVFNSSSVDDLGNGQTSFEMPFNCSPNLYQGIAKDYTTYKNVLLRFVESGTQKSEWKELAYVIEGTPRGKFGDDRFIIYIIILIIIVALIIIAIAILTENKRRKRKVKVFKQTGKHGPVDLRPRAMKSLPRHRSDIDIDLKTEVGKTTNSKPIK